MRKTDGKVIVIIRNWRKYQKALRGNSTRRSWFAVSSNIAHDPDFMALSVADRYGWLMLLAEASLHGVESESGQCSFKVCTKLFASLYQLRRNWSLDPYIKHGFIEIECHYITGQDRTGQDIPVGTQASPPAKESLPENESIPPPETQTGHPQKYADEMVWRVGLALLAEQGMQEKVARSQLGKWCKYHGAITLSGVLSDVIKMQPRPANSVAFIQSVLAGKGMRNTKPSRLDQNIQVMQEWLQESQA